MNAVVSHIPDPTEDYYRDYASTVAGALHMAYDRWEEACREHDASSLDLDRMLWSGRAQAYSAVVRLLAGCPAGKLRQDPELRLELFQVVKGTPTDAQEAK